MAKQLLLITTKKPESLPEHTGPIERLSPIKEGEEISNLSKRANNFFRNPTTTRKEKEAVGQKLAEEYVLDDLQAAIFRLCYVEHRSLGYVADHLGYSYSKIKKELSTIRLMMHKLDML